jgi:mercuric reductase
VILLTEEFDLVIIGRGASAFSAAIKASELTSGQASIAMIGFGPLGGTCVNVGCVPSKYLIEAAKVVHTQANPKYPGLSSSYAKVDFRRLMDSLRETVLEERTTKYDEVLKSYNNVKIFDGRATFIDRDKVAVKNDSEETVVMGYNFIIATGSSTKIKKITGLPETGYLTSDNVWDMDRLPQMLAIIGGGSIGFELGQALSRLGSHVKIIKEHNTITAGIEPELEKSLMESLSGEGIEFLIGRKVAKVFRRDGKKVVETTSTQGREEISADEILLASGRAANVNSLGLEMAGVEYTENGIKVNESLMTSNPMIYAAGDVVNQRYRLETLAAREGVIAATNIFNHLENGINIRQIPWAIFTEPQFASVGYTEAEYSSRFGKVESRIVPLISVPKARILKEDKGMFKIVTDAQNGKVVGVHVVSPYAAEFIIEGVYAINFGLTYSDLIENSHIFPTVAEGVKLTAQSFSRDISKMSCCME